MRLYAKKILRYLSENENKKAGAILALAILLFLFPSIITHSYFIHVDIFSTNYLDTTGQILPWFKLAKEILQNGNWPLWNDFSGMGLPFLANMQAAVFFPLSWLFFIFGVKTALLLSISLKLFSAGFFTYLFLREIKLSFWPSLAAATAVTFSGAFMIWPQWSLSNVVMLLPVFLWATQKAFSDKKTFYALLFGPLVALGVFAGHPQTFFYIFFVVCCFAAFQIFCDAGNPLTWKIFGWLIGSIILGLAISLPQLLPFLEYLKLSANLDYRAGFSLNPFFLTKNLFISNLIPDFFGNPGYRNFSYLLVPNYSEITMGYAGLGSFLLAFYGLANKNKTRAHWFFIVLAVFCFCLIYMVNPIYFLVNKLPGFNWDYNNRLLYIWAFCVPILGAFGLEDIFRNGLKKKRLLISTLIIIFFSLFLLMSNRHAELFSASQVAWKSIVKWQNVFYLLFLFHLLAAGTIIYLAAKKTWAKWLLLIFIFLETGAHALVFNRTTPNSQFYPETPVIKFLAGDYKQNPYRTFVYGHVFLPNFATWYGFNELSDYDVMYLKSNKQLKQNIAEYNYSPEYTFQNPDLNALRFFSAKWLLYPKSEGQKLLQTKGGEVSLKMEDGHYMLLQIQNVFPRAFMINDSDQNRLQTDLSELIKKPDLNKIRAAALTISRDGSMQATLDQSTEGYLVTTDNYFPGWQAKFSSGKTIPAENILGMRAIKLPGGETRAAIEYRPKNFFAALWASFGAAILWLCLLFYAKRRPNA